MQIQKARIEDIKPNTENPRLIKDFKFTKLVQSVKDFPKMLELRPIVVNDDNVILGGNMRYKACVEAGIKEVTIVKAKDLTEEQQKEFIVKDNVGFGEWDWDVLANEWDVQKLDEWGLPLPDIKLEAEDIYTRKIKAPIYEPNGIRPNIKDLVNTKKTSELIKQIDESNIGEEEKEFLKMCAYRHLVFDYSKIADLYANSEKDLQELIEKSGLVIIDFKKAIENGFVEMTEQLAEAYE